MLQLTPCRLAVTMAVMLLAMFFSCEAAMAQQCSNGVCSTRSAGRPVFGRVLQRGFQRRAVRGRLFRRVRFFRRRG